MLCLDFYIILSEVWISGNVYICVKVWLFLRFIGFIDLSKPSSNAEGFREGIVFGRISGYLNIIWPDIWPYLNCTDFTILHKPSSNSEGFNVGWYWNGYPVL